MEGLSFIHAEPSDVDVLVFDAVPERTIYAVLDGKRVGNISWYESGEISMIRVKLGYRRWGIGTALWQEACQVSRGRVFHSDCLTPDGAAWVTALSGAQRAVTAY